MKKKQPAKWRPFHKAIVEVIRQASLYSELVPLAQLLRLTRVPKWHRRIIAAWLAACRRLDVNMASRFVTNVVASLHEQEKEAAKAARAKKKAAKKKTKK